MFPLCSKSGGRHVEGFRGGSSGAGVDRALRRDDRDVGAAYPAIVGVWARFGVRARARFHTPPEPRPLGLVGEKQDGRARGCSPAWTLTYLRLHDGWKASRLLGRYFLLENPVNADDDHLQARGAFVQSRICASSRPFGLFAA